MENHHVYLENKQRLTVTEVMGVDAFDEETILADLKDESLIISGKNLHIEALDLEEGRMVASGEIDSFVYAKKKSGRRLWERLGRKK
ncbi:MAG: YabP/YqfC family sporulation protein [Emergencia sp.]|nr:YabP/YqfC family sporulation protein [Emergencia sp.]